VITRAGAGSVHESWLSGPEARLFDLVVAEWQPTNIPIRHDGVTRELIPGPRNAGYAAYLARNAEIFEKYKYIALIDDDVLMSTDDLNRCFQIGERRYLQLWQPSLTWDSYFSYAFVLHNPLFELRYSNFIEMMCPFFSSELLRLATPTFSLGYLVGIDVIWTRLLKDGNLKYAVVDSVKARHTRPVGANKRLHGFSGGRGYGDEVAELLQRLDIEFRGPVVYAGVSKTGRLITNTWALSASVSAILPALQQSRNRPFALARILDHARHIITRPSLYAPIPPAGLERLATPSSAAV
jgi:hypothetical protein